MKRPLLIMACSATKLDTPGPLCAYERYDGPAYRVLRKAGYPSVTGPDCRLLVLSAQHGLISGFRMLTVYDRQMDDRTAAQLAATDDDVLRATIYTPSHRTRGRFNLFEHDEVLVFGGGLYRRVVEAWADRGILGDGPIAYTAGGIGEQLAALKRWLESKKGQARDA
jgi:hypothetical protein